MIALRRMRFPAIAFVLGLTVLLSPLSAEETVFGGVGLHVVPTIDGQLVVLNVLAGTPAAKKGVQPGDLIIKVDDFDLQGSDFGKVVADHLWGPVGSAVELVYRRPGAAGERRVEITRTAIDPRLTVTPAVRDAGSDPQGGQP